MDVNPTRDEPFDVDEYLRARYGKVPEPEVVMSESINDNNFDQINTFEILEDDVDYDDTIDNGFDDDLEFFDDDVCCPCCGINLDESTDICPICGQEFEENI